MYRNLSEFIARLEREGELQRVSVPVDPVYEITAPVFDVVRIKLSPTYYSGKEFVIRTYNNSKSNCYIRKSSLNGKTLDTFWFYHKDFAKGGTLELWLDDSFPEADSTSIK